MRSRPIECSLLLLVAGIAGASAQDTSPSAVEVAEAPPATAAEVPETFPWVSPGEPYPELLAGSIRYIDTLPEVIPCHPDDPWTDHLDHLHDRLFLAVQHRAEWFDHLFARDGYVLRTPVSRFRLASITEVIDEDGISLGFDPDFDMDVNLPNTERRLNVFITNRELDELPGSQEEDTDRQYRVGLRRRYSDAINLELGVRAESRPDLFTRARYDKGWDMGDWHGRTHLDGFWEVDEGFGTTASVSADRWYGRTFLRASSGLRWTEATVGLEWSENVIFGYAHELIEEDRHGERVKGSDIALGGGIRLTAEGTADGGFGTELYRGSIFYRRPLRDRWILGVVEPQVTFRNETDWEPEFGVRFGFDLLFWDLARDGL